MTANGDGVSFGVMRMFWNKVIVSQHLNMQKHSELCPFGEFYLLNKFFFFKIKQNPSWASVAILHWKGDGGSGRRHLPEEAGAGSLLCEGRAEATWRQRKYAWARGSAPS